MCADFATVMKLTKNKRLDATGIDAVIFDKFLDTSRDRGKVAEGWKTLWGKHSLLAMSVGEWKHKYFNDGDSSGASFTSILVYKHGNEIA